MIISTWTIFVLFELGSCSSCTRTYASKFNRNGRSLDKNSMAHSNLSSIESHVHIFWKQGSGEFQGGDGEAAENLQRLGMDSIRGLCGWRCYEGWLDCAVMVQKKVPMSFSELKQYLQRFWLQRRLLLKGKKNGLPDAFGAVNSIHTKQRPPSSRDCSSICW